MNQGRGPALTVDDFEGRVLEQIDTVFKGPPPLPIFLHKSFSIYFSLSYSHRTPVFFLICISRSESKHSYRERETMGRFVKYVESKEELDNVVRRGALVILHFGPHDVKLPSIWIKSSPISLPTSLMPFSSGSKLKSNL